MIPSDQTLTIADRFALEALRHQPDLAAHHPPFDPAWLARMEAAHWLHILGPTVAVHPWVARWWLDTGQLHPRYAVVQPIAVTLDAWADEPEAPWVVGYSDGFRWNGSLQPWLPLHAARAICDRVGPGFYCPDTDTLSVSAPEPGTPDTVFVSADLRTPTAPAHLYRAEGWLWADRPL